MSPGTVYFARPIGMDGPIKIGCSNHPLGRVIGLSEWSPFPLEVVATCPGGYALERNLHDCFAAWWSHKEWFRANPRLLAGIAALAAGAPVEQAFDLTDKSGDIRTLRRRKNPARPGPKPGTRHWTWSEASRERARARRAERSNRDSNWIAEAQALRLKGYSLRKIGQKFNLSGERIRQICKPIREMAVAKVAEQRQRKFEWKPAEDKRLKALWDEAYSVAEIANRIGRSAAKVTERAEALDLGDRSLWIKDKQPVSRISLAPISPPKGAA